jgi:predicted transcriptional regulator of viral defense system
MSNRTRSPTPSPDDDATTTFFARNPVFRLEDWVATSRGRNRVARTHERARYHVETGRLLRLGRGLFAVVPPGRDAKSFDPDPYWVAATYRPDAILSHHSALDLHGVRHSVSRRFPFLTAGDRHALKFRGAEWKPLRHPAELVKKRKTAFGLVSMDREGKVLRVTSPERTLVDGFAAPTWCGGLEEHVNSCEGFRSLDLDLLSAYLKLWDWALLYSAVGWFLESRPTTAEATPRFLARLEAKRLVRSHYLGGRRADGAFIRRWNLILPSVLRPEFEGARVGADA